MSANALRTDLSTNQVRSIVGVIMIYVGGFGLLVAVGTKFAHLPPVVAQLTSADWLRCHASCLRDYRLGAPDFSASRSHRALLRPHMGGSDHGRENHRCRDEWAE
jgi:hypothetical protein